MISILMIMRYIFLNKLQLKKPIIALLTAGVLSNALIGVFVLMRAEPTSVEMMDFISNVIYIVTAKLLTNEKKLGKIIWIIMLYIMSVDMLFSLISPYISEQLYAECIVNTLMFTAVCVLIHLLAEKTRFNLLPKVFDEIPRWVFVAVMLFDLTCYYKEFGISASWYEAFYIVSSVLVIGCVAYLFFKIFQLSYEQSSILRQIQLQSDYFEERLSAQSDLRSFRHDYKNHMIVVTAYLESGKIREARAYLESINSSIQSSISNISTGNFVADAVLNNKIQFAKNNGITISFSGYIPGDGIEPQDLCLILSNLLDNAIEACEKVTAEKHIEVESGMRQSSFILSVSNPCVSAPIKRKGVIKTTKKDKALHGIGLKNVSAAAQKYGGVLITQYEDGKFSADVRLSVKQVQTSN